MRSFFDAMAPWPQNEGSLHLYVAPDLAARERLLAAQEALVGVEHLPLMPPAYLHLTVQRLSQFDDLPQAEFTRLADHLTPAIESVPAFSLQMGAPALHETAIEVTAAPSQRWDALVAAVRRGLADAYPGDELLAPPHAAHLSLGYATGPASDEVVRERLRDLDPIGELRVEGVQLVSVTVRPELGIFDFIELAGWSLN